MRDTIAHVSVDSHVNIVNLIFILLNFIKFFLIANDIGVARIRGSITFTDIVKAIDYSSDEVPDGVNLQLTGWGATRGGGRLPQRLQIIQLKSVTTKRCREIYGGGNVHDSHICTFNGKGQGACNVSWIFL